MNIHNIGGASVPDLVAFAIPILLVFLGCSTRKLIEGGPWRWSYFFIGLDLTIYFLTACLVNVLDLTRQKDRPEDGYIWTVCLITIAVLALFYQTTVHQDWERREKSSRGQIFMLCFVSNGIGLSLLYGFVRLKIERVI